MALGMSLLLIALQKADAGIVATLSSTSPIMILLLTFISILESISTPVSPIFASALRNSGSKNLSPDD